MIALKPFTGNFQAIANDPLQVKIYTLQNGLKLYLSVNRHEPRIFTNIAVRSGSKQDPSETTGLAHYMEHMLFKGTSRIGALDWETEKVLLQKISDLYEQHRKTTDEETRRAIYAEIDRVSGEAAQLVAANEYDKLVSAIGAKDTNAYTWVDQTVYVNDIPANELERWMQLESERFSMMALRLFHTELETVYEEFNISQDRDFRKVYNALRESLFPSHPYGTQTTIGKSEHLKNPSHVNIQWYFSTYYVPNNMAIVLAGDFDPDEVVALAERYWGSYEPKTLPPFNCEEQPSFSQPVRREVLGQEAPHVELAWRLAGSATDEPLMLSLIKGLLYNDQAGLLDTDLNQQQLVLESEAWGWFYADYSVLGLFGKPREGQTLEEVEQLMLQVVTRLQKGDFDNWLIEAVINNMRLSQTKAWEQNRHRAEAMTTAFILDINWQRYVDRLQWMRNVTKQQIVDFANERLRADNYAVVYKRQGTDPTVVKVDKPPITPVALQRDTESDFARNFLQFTSPRLQPHFVDFDTRIQTLKLAGGITLDYVQNEDNDLFRLDFVFEMGKSSDLLMSLALQYLPYLGTSRYSATELQKEFFRLGLAFDVFTHEHRTYISLNGLESSFEEGLQLVEHVLSDVRPDEQALRNVVADILTTRENNKRDRNVVLRDALGSYARYGAHSPFTYRLSEEALKTINPVELVRIIQSLISFEHNIYFYGNRPAQEAATLLERYHQAPAVRQPVLPNKHFPQLPTESDKVYFLDFPIVQTDVMLLSRGTPFFNLEEHLMRELYNEYFGYGLSSIVFQEIRESKALAYATYAYYSSPRRKDHSHYLQAYVGTQPDKLSDALPAMFNIIEQMPVVEAQIESARQSLIKQIESERIPPANIYWEALSNWDLGHDGDLRRPLYHRMKETTVSDFLQFHQNYVKGRSFHLILMGSREQIDLSYLDNFGELEELTLDDVFGY